MLNMVVTFLLLIEDSLAKKWGEVLARCQSIMSQNAEIWVASAEWYKFKGDHDKVCNMHSGPLVLSHVIIVTHI